MHTFWPQWLPVHEQRIVTKIAEHIQRHTRHAKHSYLTMQAVRMDMMCTFEVLAIRIIDNQDILGVLKVVLGSLHKMKTAQEFLFVNIEHIGHGGYKIQLLPINGPFGVDELQQTEEHDGLLLLNELGIDGRAYPQDLYRALGNALTFLFRLLFLTSVVFLKILIEYGKVFLYKVLPQLLIEENANHLTTRRAFALGHKSKKLHQCSQYTFAHIVWGGSK
jgi:hypothetical protein